MYQRPYLTALWMSVLSVLGIIGQMVTIGMANAAFLCLAVAPVALGLARLRWRR